MMNFDEAIQVLEDKIEDLEEATEIIHLANASIPTPPAIKERIKALEDAIEVLREANANY